MKNGSGSSLSTAACLICICLLNWILLFFGLFYYRYSYDGTKVAENVTFQTINVKDVVVDVVYDSNPQRSSNNKTTPAEGEQ
jgi:hypothetical protein